MNPQSPNDSPSLSPTGATRGRGPRTGRGGHVPPAPPDVSESNPLSTDHSQSVHSQETSQEAIAPFLEEIQETIRKMIHDQTARGDVKIIARAMKELRYAFKVFRPYRKNRKVTVFGSARLKADHPAYQAAVDFGRRMAQAGWLVVTGAGNGIMEAAHVGAGREMSMGLNIMLPFEQSSNPIIIDDPKLVHLKYFFTRKLLMVKEVHGIVLFEGGFGTQDEGFESLTLVQTGKRDLMPIVCVDSPGGSYWKNWKTYVEGNLLKTGLISPPDMSLFKVTDKSEEAYDEIMRFYSVYNSMRYVREMLYLRLHKEPSDAFVEKLNTEFADIITSGKIFKTSVHPLEADDEHLKDLFRLAFHFNRHDFGRLRQLVDRINEC